MSLLFIRIIIIMAGISVVYVSGQTDTGRITEHLGDTTLAIIGLLSFAIIIRLSRKRNSELNL